MKSTAHTTVKHQRVSVMGRILAYFLAAGLVITFSFPAHGEQIEPGPSSQCGKPGIDPPPPAGK